MSDDKCRRCGGEMKAGIAIGETVRGYADFANCEVVTLSPGGPGYIKDCLKCIECGHSITESAGLMVIKSEANCVRIKNEG